MDILFSGIKLITYSQENILLLTEKFIEMFTGKEIEKLHYPKSFILETFDYPELHEESVSFIILNRKLQYIMFSVGVEDFSINDYINPNITKKRKILLALTNFSLFRQKQIFILNKIGFNLKKINIECYLTLNRLLINKYKIKFVKNTITKNGIHIKNLNKKFYKTVDFIGIVVQLCFFFLKKNYFNMKIITLIKILLNIKSIILIRNNNWTCETKNYMFSKFEKKKNIIIQLFRLYKINIFFLSPIIDYIDRILYFLILIANLIKTFLQYYIGFTIFSNNCLFKFLIFPKMFYWYKTLFILNFKKKRNNFNVKDVLKNKKLDIASALTFFTKGNKHVIFFGSIQKNIQNSNIRIYKQFLVNLLDISVYSS
jgi:hypothetical protein